jgi:hypothetical protein
MSEENQTTEAAPQLSVTVQDVANAYAIIDLAAKRGAFQATELQAVGTVANKLKAFIDAVASAQKAQQESAETPAETAEADSGEA